MSDAELSRRLGAFQRIEAICIIFTVISAIGCVAVLFFYKNLIAAALFAVAATCILIGNAARRKKAALLNEQLGDFFSSEFEKKFGPEQAQDKTRIDKLFMEKFRLSDGQWEECFISGSRSGTWRETGFSAANVRLDHRYQKKNGQEGVETFTETVFDGLVVRCKTANKPLPLVRIDARTTGSPDGFLTGDGNFDERFVVRASNAADVSALLTPELIGTLVSFEQSMNGGLSGVIFEENVLSLAVATKKRFAAVPDSIDLRDIDAVRRTYIGSLDDMSRSLNILFESETLFGKTFV